MGKSTGIAGKSQTSVFSKMHTGPQFEQALAQAKAQRKPVVIDLYADWCVSCKELEAFTFSDAKVQSLLSQHAVNIKLDITDNSETDKALLKRFGLVGPPAIIFLNSDGEEIRQHRQIGFVKAEKFAEILKKAFKID
jgi:thiol:disulfide interchange protein DsbD